MKLSIVTINYNNAAGLQKTMDSVFGQTYADYEYIIIDGGSTDGSKEIIENNADRLAYWVSKKDKGVYHAMNKGISYCSGDYIMFLNSGDCLINNNILESVFHMIKTANSDIIYGNIEVNKKDGGIEVIKHPSTLTLNNLFEKTLNHQACFFKQTLFSSIGLYNEKFKMAADYAFYFIAFLRGHSFQYLNLVLVNYELGGESDINWKEYRLQMKQVQDELTPYYLKEIREDLEQKNLVLQHRIIKWALSFDKLYHRINKKRKQV